MSVFIFHLITHTVLVAHANLEKMTAQTVPYFELSERPPAPDQAPLSSSGIFGSDTKGGKYIREQKFSVSWSGGINGEPSLMVALNPLAKYSSYGKENEQPEATLWVRNNLFLIASNWEAVLNELDEQTTIPV